MYCPAHFAVEAPEALFGLIAQYPLATLISHGETGLVADHIPMLHQPTADGFGRLIGHVAKSNPLWQVSPDQELLLVFQGPSTYISPNWYASKAASGKVVPTWNYAVVHAHGTLKAIQSPDALLDILTRLTQVHEAAQTHPWQVSDAPTDFTERLLDHIVGIEISIRRLQGKWKVSQNQSGENQGGVVQGLSALDSDEALRMADLVKRFAERE